MKSFKSFNESNFKPRSYHNDVIMLYDSIFDDEQRLNELLEKIDIFESSNIDYIMYYHNGKNWSYIRINCFPNNREKIKICKKLDFSYFNGYISKDEVIKLREQINWTRVTKDEIIYSIKAKKFNI